MADFVYGHWALAVIDNRKLSITFYDSTTNIENHYRHADNLLSFITLYLELNLLWK